MKDNSEDVREMTDEELAEVVLFFEDLEEHPENYPTIDVHHF